MEKELTWSMLRYIAELMLLSEQEIEELRRETLAKFRESDDPGLLLHAFDEIFNIVLTRKRSLPRAVPGTMEAYSVYGDCMEGAGIYEDDLVLCDTGLRPKQGGNLVMFQKKGEVPCLKMFCGVYGSAQWVRTCYKDPGSDYKIHVPDEAFIGVVAQVLSPDGVVKQSFDVSNYPTELQHKRTLDCEPCNAGLIQKIRHCGTFAPCVYEKV